MLGFTFVAPLLPLYLGQLAGVDPTEAGRWSGIAFGIAPLLTALVSPWWGAMSDRTGQKLMLQRALAAIGVAIALMAAARGPLDVVGLRAVIGVLGGINVAALAAVSAGTPRQQLGPAIGTLQSVQLLGSVVGPGLGGALGDLVGLRPAFVIAGGLFGVGLLLVSWLYQEPPRGERAVEPVVEPASDEQRAAAPRSRFGAPGLPLILVALFAASFVDGSFVLLLPLLLGPLGAPPGTIATLAGLGVSAGALAVSLASVVAGRLTVRRPPLQLLATALGLGAVVMVPLLLVSAWWQLLALRTLLGLLAGAAPTLAYAAAATATAPGRQGAQLGVVSTAGMLGWALAPALSGFLVEIDARVILALDLALYVASALAVRAGVRARTRAPSAA